MSKHGNILDRTQCPECYKDGNDTAADNLVVHETGYAKCYACDYFTYNLEGYEPQEPTPKKVIPFIEQITYKDLKVRGIREKVARHYGYGYATFMGSTVQVAPFKDDHGQLLGQKLRFKNKSFVWTGLSTRRFFGQHLHRKGKRLAITEGEIDCMSVAQVIGTNWPVVSLPSGAGYAKASKVIEENLEWLKNFDEIVLFMDADEEGREATKAFADLLPGKCLVAQYPDGYKDANALLVDKREADIKTAYWNAVTADVDNDLMDFGDFTLESLKEEPKVGHPLPFPGMQDAMRGFRKGEVTLFAAGTGIGKSTLTREIGYHLAHVTGLRVGNVYMEEQHQTSWKGYYALHNKIPLVEIEENPDLITEEGYQEASKLFGNNLVIAKNSVEWEHGKLLSKLESLAKSKKCDFIILDHISIAIAGMETDNEARAIEEFMKHLYKLANRTNVGILTVVHLRKAENDKDWSEGLVPKKNHLKGSSALGQYSHNIFVASRDETDEDERYITYLWQLKCRSYSKYNNQCTDALRFNFDTGRLDPIAKFPDKSSEPTKKAKAKPDHGFTPVNNQDF